MYFVKSRNHCDMQHVGQTGARSRASTGAHILPKQSPRRSRFIIKRNNEARWDMPVIEQSWRTVRGCLVKANLTFQVSISPFSSSRASRIPRCLACELRGNERSGHGGLAPIDKNNCRGAAFLVWGQSSDATFWAAEIEQLSAARASSGFHPERANCGPRRAEQCCQNGSPVTRLIDDKTRLQRGADRPERGDVRGS